jgi:membrane fusion protein (multidrug efflux system)
MNRSSALRLLSSPLSLLAFLATGCSKAPESSGFQMPPTAVESTTVESGALREELASLGTVEATERVSVVSEIDALVEALPFVEGAFVAKGSVLARLRDADLKAQVERAKALRDEARVAYERLARLTEEELLSRQEKDSAAARVAVAEADLRVAEVQLAKTRVLAPFAGLLSRRLVSPGAFLRAGDPIVELAAIDQVKVAFAVPERHLAAFSAGSGIELSSVAYPGVSFAGEILLVDPLVDPVTRSARLLARVENPGRRLRPGMSVEVRATLAVREAALTVPEEAVFAEGDANYVFLVAADSTVERRAVTLGSRQGGRVEVVAGLAAGDTVVRTGHQKLFPGAKVTPVVPAGDPDAQPDESATESTG